MLSTRPSQIKQSLCHGLSEYEDYQLRLDFELKGPIFELSEELKKQRPGRFEASPVCFCLRKSPAMITAPDRPSACTIRSTGKRDLPLNLGSWDYQC